MIKFVVTSKALSPKQGDTRVHTLYWDGDRTWSTEPDNAHEFDTHEAAEDAITNHPTADFHRPWTIAPIGEDALF